MHVVILCSVSHWCTDLQYEMNTLNPILWLLCIHVALLWVCSACLLQRFGSCLFYWWLEHMDLNLDIWNLQTWSWWFVTWLGLSVNLAWSVISLWTWDANFWHLLFWLWSLSHVCFIDAWNVALVRLLTWNRRACFPIHVVCNLKWAQWMPSSLVSLHPRCIALGLLCILVALSDLHDCCSPLGHVCFIEAGNLQNWPWWFGTWMGLSVDLACIVTFLACQLLTPAVLIVAFVTCLLPWCINGGLVPTVEMFTKKEKGAMCLPIHQHVAASYTGIEQETWVCIAIACWRMCH